MLINEVALMRCVRYNKDRHKVGPEVFDGEHLYVLIRFISIAKMDVDMIYWKSWGPVCRTGLSHETPALNPELGSGRWLRHLKGVDMIQCTSRSPFSSIYRSIHSF